jgi:hypothetical protein
MQGTVKTVNWTNPHITFVIEQRCSRTANRLRPGCLKSRARRFDPLGLDQTLAPARRSRVFHYAPLRDGNPGGFLQKVDAAERSGTQFSCTPPINER